MQGDETHDKSVTRFVLVDLKVELRMMEGSQGGRHVIRMDEERTVGIRNLLSRDESEIRQVNPRLFIEKVKGKQPVQGFGESRSRLPAAVIGSGIRCSVHRDGDREKIREEDGRSGEVRPG